MVKKKVFGLVGALALLALARPASAIVVIDFGTSDAGSGGTLTCLNVACTQMSGSGIVVDSMTVAGSGATDGNYDVFGTVTGSSEAHVGSLDFNTLTNTISITGGICSLASPNCNGGTGTLIASTTLLSGSFNSFTITSGGLVGNISGVGPDAKSPALLTALGIPSGTSFQFFGFSTGFNLSFGGSPYTAISTDITNTSTPEPASIFLLGTVLFGVTQILRRRNAKKGVSA